MNSKNTYHFITRWQVDATPEEVYRTLENAEELPRWWSSVYLDVNILDKGQTGGVGKVIEAKGDFVGKGIWTFTANENGTEIVYDWKIEAEKPLLKKLSGIVKPILSMNHEWAMAKGLESLKLELRRRKGEKNVPTPPTATFPHNLLKNKV
jgi:uncharacterized protein YndB with AHSA1/START domain